MKKHVARSVLIVTCALLMTVPFIAASENVGVSASAIQQPTAVVLKFAVQSQVMPGIPALSLQACPQDNPEWNADAAVSVADSAKDKPTIDPKLLDAISGALQRDLLNKKRSVMVDPHPDSVPLGAHIITGCIFQADKGSVGKRLIGFGLGASRIGAHVIVLSKGENGFAPVDSFDVQVQARNILPPVGAIGLAAHAAKAPAQTLSADADKLAAEIVKQLSEQKN